MPSNSASPAAAAARPVPGFRDADLLAQLPGQVALLGSDGRILAVNRGWRDFAASNGLTAEASADFNYLHVCAAAEGPDAADAAAALDGIRKVLQGFATSFEMQYTCHAPQQQRWLRVRVTPVHWQGLAGALVMHSDVSSEVLALDHSSTATELLRDAEAIGQLGTFRLRMGGGWDLQMSPGLRTLLGGVEPAGRVSAWRSLRRLGLQRLLDDLRGGIASSGVFHGSVAEPGAGGGRQLEVHAHQVSTPALGDVVLGVVRDVSGERLALQAQAQSRAVLRLAGSSIGSWSYDRRSGGLSVSPDIARALKLPARTVLGAAQVLRRIGSHHRGPVLGAFRAALKDGKPFEVEAQFQSRRRSKPVWLRIGGEAGAGAGVQGALQIIEDRKRTEQALAECQRTLDLLTRCHDVLTRATDESRLLADVCAAIVSTGHHPAAWVADREPMSGSLRQLAAAGVPDGLLTPDFLAWPGGAVRAALRSGRLQFVPSLRTSARYARWAGRLVPHGIEGLVAVPLVDGDTVHAALVVYLGHAGSLSQRELESVAALGRDTGHRIGTLRVRADRAAALRALSRQAALLDRAHDAIIVRGADGQVLYWNDGARRLYGWPADEAMGANVDLLVFGATPGFGELVLRIEAEGDLSTELRVRRRDGRPIVVQSTWTLMRGDDGAPSSMLAICTDVTQRRQIADQLARSQALLESAQAIAQLASVEIDHATGALTGTAGLDRILGLSRPPRALVDLSRAMAAPSAAALAEWLEQPREGGPAGLELKVVGSRSVRWVRAVRALVPAPHPAARRSTVVFQDVTDVRKARDEVLRLNAELERRVERRTRQLEAANRNLEAFSYSVSHDLKTPLAGIEGFTHVLAQRLQGRLDEKEAGYLARVRAGVAGMYGLIDAMLSLHSVAHGRRLDLRWVDLSSIAETLVAEFCVQEPLRTCSIRIEPGILARCDEALMAAVLRNLIGNAWKFSARKPVTVIDVARDRTAGAGLTLRIADRGAGFAQEHAANLCTPFRRLHHSSEFEGTGIGLATVDRILRRHGGSIWAQGEPGVGATFWINLPQGDGLVDDSGMSRG